MKMRRSKKDEKGAKKKRRKRIEEKKQEEEEEGPFYLFRALSTVTVLHGAAGPALLPKQKSFWAFLS